MQANNKKVAGCQNRQSVITYLS